jgi:hypothetical protein
MLAATVLTVTASAAAPPGPYANGFNTPGDVGTTNQAMFNVTLDGNGHALAAVNSDAYTRYGGYSDTFPAGGYTTSADIYLDTSISTPGANLRFDWSSAIGTPDGQHRRDFIFNVGTDGAGGFVMSASNNAPGWPANPGRDPYTITQSGWYTFQHHFYNTGDNVLAVDMTVSKQGSAAPLHTWTLSDPSDIIGDTVGGNRYGWLATNDMPLKLDNITRSGVCQLAGNGLTAAQIGGDVTGTLDATGCDVGVYYDSNNPGSVNGADISGAKQYGVYVNGGSHDVTGSKIHQIGDSPFSGNQNGRAVFYAKGATGMVSGNQIYDYQKNGVVATDSGTNVQVLNNTVTGRGHLTSIAQNGVVILSGATGLVKGNSISHNWYTPTGVTAYGLLLIDANGVRQQANTFLDNEGNLGNFGRGGGSVSA